MKMRGFGKIMSLSLMMILSIGVYSQVPNNYRFLALGDSYTIGESVSINQRWPAHLSDSLNARSLTCDTLIYIAQTGWRTDQLINAINSANLQGAFDLVSLLIGVNNQYQNRNYSQFESEFPQLVNTAINLAGGDKNKLIVVSIPDYAYTPFGQNSSNPSAISAELDQYNQFKEDYCDSAGIKYVYITDISRNGLNDPALVANDGLHPSSDQYALWVQRILDNTALNLKESVQEDSLFYPNPTRGKITFSKNVEEVILFGTNGEFMFKGVPGHFRMDLPKGEYILQLQLKDGSSKKEKLIVN